MGDSRLAAIAWEVSGVVHAFVGSSLPVGVEKAPTLLGAVVEESELGPISGFLRWEPSGARIGVNRAENEVRRRFTLGHELGHLILGSPHFVAGLDLDISGLTSRGEERLCDIAAAEMLMPSREVRRFLSGGRTGVRMVQSLAAEAGVSLPAAAARLIELRSSSDVYITWQRVGTDWKVVHVINGPRRTPELRLSEVGTASLNRLGSTSPSELLLELEINRSRRCWVEVEISRGRTYVRMLARGLSQALGTSESVVSVWQPEYLDDRTTARHRRQSNWDCMPEVTIHQS